MTGYTFVKGRQTTLLEQHQLRGLRASGGGSKVCRTLLEHRDSKSYCTLLPGHPGPHVTHERWDGGVVVYIGGINRGDWP